MAATTGRAISARKILATTQGKTYTIAAITFFIVVLMFFLAIRPAFLSVTDQNSQNDIKREYLSKLTDYENNLKALAQQEVQYQDKINLLETYLPDKRNDELVAANLNAIAEKYNCKIINLGFDAGVIPKVPELLEFSNLQVVVTHIAINGSLNNIAQFIGQVETFPVALRITNLTYGGGGTDDTETDTVDLNMETEYYYWLKI